MEQCQACLAHRDDKQTPPLDDLIFTPYENGKLMTRCAVCHVPVKPVVWALQPVHFSGHRMSDGTPLTRGSVRILNGLGQIAQLGTDREDSAFSWGSPCMTAENLARAMIQATIGFDPPEVLVTLARRKFIETLGENDWRIEAQDIRDWLFEVSREMAQ